jgi:hypothetical protein
MVFPIIILVAIPIFLGMVYVTPFDLPEELNDEPISEEYDETLSEEPDGDILYFLLMGIWVFFLMRILLLMKRGRFRVTQRY